MKCPICGAENGADFKFCRECAHPLKPQNTNNSEPAAQMHEPSKSDIEDFITGQKPAESKRHEVSVPNDFFSEFDDDNDFDSMLNKPRAVAGKKDPKMPDPTTRRVSFFDDEDEEDDFNENDYRSDYDEEDLDADFFESSPQKKSDPKRRSFSWDDDYEEDFMSTKQKKNTVHDKRGRNGKSAALWITTCTVLVFVIALFAVFLIKNYDGNLGLFFGSVFGSSPITRAAEVTLGETDTGDPAVIIKVFARKGMMVRFQEGDVVETATVNGTSVTFCAPQSLWIPQTPVDSTSITITPTVYVINPSSNETTQVEISPVEVPLPAAAITLVKPETPEIVTDSDTIEIAGYISDPAAGVFIGDNQLQTDSNGYFRTTYKLDTLGEHEIYIEARKAGMGTNHTKITVTYTKEDLALSVNDVHLLRTFTDTIEITGTMDAGAELTVSGVEVVGDINIDSATGNFSFTLSVPEEKLYEPSLKVTVGNVTSEKKIYVEHAPDRDTYIRKSRDFDYNKIVSTPTMEYHYEVRGKIVEVIQTDPYVIAKMQTTDGHFITFNYYTQTASVEANDGKTYRIYAKNLSLDEEGNPVMYCWFIYK